MKTQYKLTRKNTKVRTEMLGEKSRANNEFVYCDVTTMPNAAANIIAVAAHPTIFVKRPFSLSPITFLLFEMIMMMTSNGGAKTPLMTAVQKSASMGLMPIKLMSIPIKVEIAITA